MAERTTSAEDTQNQHCQCVHTNVDTRSQLHHKRTTFTFERDSVMSTTERVLISPTKPAATSSCEQRCNAKCPHIEELSRIAVLAGKKDMAQRRFDCHTTLFQSNRLHVIGHKVKHHGLQGKKRLTIVTGSFRTRQRTLGHIAETCWMESENHLECLQTCSLFVLIQIQERIGFDTTAIIALQMCCFGPFLPPDFAPG